MNNQDSAADRVRPIIRAMEQCVAAARRQRLHGSDADTPAPREEPVGTEPTIAGAPTDNPARLKARPKRTSSFPVWNKERGQVASPREPGTNGTNGAHRTNGTNGTNKTNGTNGTNGAHRTNGINGAPGTNGAPGDHGGHRDADGSRTTGPEGRSEPTDEPPRHTEPPLRAEPLR